MTARPEVTERPEVTPPVHRKSLPSPPEVTPQTPEVTARPEVKKCALLHNGITGLIFVLDVVGLGLWYRFGVILNNACAWSNIG